MALKLNRLSAKFVASVTKPGRYADGAGLYLEVGEDGRAKSYVFIYDRKRFGNKTPVNIGVGSARTVSLPQARRTRDAYRDQIRDGIDPLAKRKADREKRLLGDAKDMSFKTIADDFVDYKSRRAPKPWKQSTREEAEYIIKKHLKQLHNLRSADVTPKHIFDIVDRLRAKTPSMANAVRIRAQTIFAWAEANEAMEGRANPASMRGPASIGGRYPL